MSGAKKSTGADKSRRSWGRLTSVGFELVVGAALFAYLGYKLDERYGTEPIWVIVGALLGVTGSLYVTVRTAIRTNEARARAERREKEEARKNEASGGE